MVVQSILVPYRYSLDDAIRWVMDHDYVVRKIDFTDKYMRFRQFTPTPDYHYRTMKLPTGIRLIIGY